MKTLYKLYGGPYDGLSFLVDLTLPLHRVCFQTIPISPQVLWAINGERLPGPITFDRLATYKLYCVETYQQQTVSITFTCVGIRNAHKGDRERGLRWCETFLSIGAK